MGRTHLTLLLWIIYGNVWKKTIRVLVLNSQSFFQYIQQTMAGGPVLSHGPPTAGDSRTTVKAREGITLFFFICLWNTQSSHALKLSYISNMIDAVIVTRELQIIKISWCINVVFFFHAFCFKYSKYNFIMNDFFFILWPGPTRGFPVAGYDVHKVHPDIQKDGAVLWPDRSSPKTPSSSSRLRWNHGKNLGVEAWNGQPRVLRIPLLWRCFVRSETYTCKWF